MPNSVATPPRRAPLRVGVVGCGRLAELAHLPALEGSAELELVALADPFPERRERLAALAASSGPRPSTHSSAEELISAAAPEAVIVCSPAEHHLDGARAAAAAKLPCLVEKPPAPDGAGAGEIAALRPAPLIGFNRRFAHQSVRDRAPRSGPLELELELSYRRDSWRALDVHDEALLDLAPHLVDLAGWIWGIAPGEVRCDSRSEDRCRLQLRGSRGTARIRCATDGLHRELVRATAPGGSGIESSIGGRMAVLTGRLRRGPHPLQASIAAQLAAFAAAARDGAETQLASAAEGAAVMRALDAARDSAGRGGEWVPVEAGVGAEVR